MVEVIRGREAGNVEVEDARVHAGGALQREQDREPGQRSSPPPQRPRPARSEVVRCSRDALALSDDGNRLDRGWRSAVGADARAPGCRLAPSADPRKTDGGVYPEPQGERDQFQAWRSCRAGLEARRSPRAPRPLEGDPAIVRPTKREQRAIP